ncbi:MAG: glycosyltransferase family 39 protein, partial [Acidobacteria bacterium]|nr:glycosyltransferase family 39 protein [Acidobacteriota bacterium]
MTRQHILIVVLFIAAAGLRFADVFRPINQASWRECDLGAVSRNFVREGMDPLMPRIDWRGNGPGYAEMELPLYPFLTAATYEAIGIRDDLGRIWSFLFSLGAMFFFFKIAREYLTVFASTVAFAFFALNPLMVRIATSIQPEGIMLLTYLAAVYFFIRWLRTDRTLHFWIATA